MIDTMNIIRWRIANVYLRDPDAPIAEIKYATWHATHNEMFGKDNDYFEDQELPWYQSQSLLVDDMPGKVPGIWREIADDEGRVHSNYGWAIWSHKNGNQFVHVLGELSENPKSRRADMIYTRPSMHTDVLCGPNDFMCTRAVNYSIDDRNRLNAYVDMRSNDLVFGYRNDQKWQQYVLVELAKDLHGEGLDVLIGDIVWHATSAHVYKRHYYLIEKFLEENEYDDLNR